MGGYYQDKDDAMYIDADVAREMREFDRERARDARNFKRAVAAEVARQIGKQGLKEQRGERQTFNCDCCGKPFSARTADRKRGWARFCNKSCKAIKQDRMNPSNRDYYGT